MITQLFCINEMDKRELAQVFSERLRALIGTEKKSVARFLTDTSIDRSALSQFLDPESVRLPRAETLRSIADASGVSIDWLLGMENSPEGRQQITSSIEIESEVQMDGTTSLSHWHAEAAGLKLRYVPSALPDMMNLSTGSDQRSIFSKVNRGSADKFLGSIKLEDLDLEIAMPIQTLEELSSQSGIWRGASANLCKQQLIHMAQICETSYPTLRLHLYDASRNFSVPYMIFGKKRVALYIGDAYLVTTMPNQIKSFVKKFDTLVRETVVTPDKVHTTLLKLASRILD